MAAGNVNTNDFRNFNAASMEQVFYLETLFKAISALDDYQTIRGLARVGSFLAAVLHNDIDVFDANFGPTNS
jgi:hypothetical protein